MDFQFCLTETYERSSAESERIYLEVESTGKTLEVGVIKTNELFIQESNFRRKFRFPPVFRAIIRSMEHEMARMEDGNFPDAK